MSTQSSTQTPSAVSPSPENKPANAITVLIVDDDPNLRMLLSYALKQEGYETIEAQDGMEALQVLKKQQPAIILMDAIMPRLDGISCCMELQEIYQEKCPPIILITALSDVKSIDRAFQAGASDFVTKPIHWPILKKRIMHMLEFVNLQQDMQLAQVEIQDLRSQLANCIASLELPDSN